MSGTTPQHEPYTGPDESARRLAGPVLIIGADGMLGRAWGRLLSGLGIDYTRPTLDELELTNPDTIRRVIDGNWPIVVNCAAWTDVDGAEENEEEARKVNAIGVGDLAAQCARVSATLVHHSTDYVFNGRASEPYTVDQSRSPLGAYGRTKAEGEAALEQSGCRYLLIRTSWLYAPWGQNFVKTMARLMAEKPSLRVVNDQRGRPTSAEHLARVGLSLLGLDQTGTFHATDGGQCTWFDFAAEIARLTNSTCRVEPCTSEEFPRPAPRPAYSVLDLSRTEALLGSMPHWKSNLADVVARLET
jgi:dTDP-4-dehydrorhamnose reductase